MKLEGLRRPVRRERAASVLRQENEADVNFDAERDLGEAYKLKLLSDAERIFERGIRDSSFFNGLMFLTTYYVLFPQDRDQVGALLDRFKIEERIMTRPAGVPFAIFIDVGILFPKLKPELKPIAGVLWLKMNPEEGWGDTNLAQRFHTAFNFISVDPEYLEKVLKFVSPEKLFVDFQELYKQAHWKNVLEYGAALRLCFPDEFVVPQFTPAEWKNLIKIVKDNDRRPDLGFDLAVLAAEEASLLGPGGFKLTPKKTAMVKGAGLPPRQTF